MLQTVTESSVVILDVASLTSVTLDVVRFLRRLFAWRTPRARADCQQIYDNIRDNILHDSFLHYF